MTLELWPIGARTGFFKPVHVKSLPAHAPRSRIIARKELVGQRVTLETRSEASRSCSAVMTAVPAIDADTRRMTRASSADDRRPRWSTDCSNLCCCHRRSGAHWPITRVGAYFRLIPRRYQFGEADYVVGIPKCEDRRLRTLMYEAANVMLTRYKAQLKDWAFAIARRSRMHKEANTGSP